MNQKNESSGRGLRERKTKISGKDDTGGLSVATEEV